MEFLYTINHMTYTINTATIEDVRGIRDMLHESYYSESIYNDNLEYDANAAAEYIASWVNEICFIARNESNEIVGVLSAFLMKTYYKQPECQVVVFYIHPSERGSGLSREFVDLLVKTADLNQAGATYTTSASGMGDKNNELYTNLFKKGGFIELGTELVRFKNV